MVISVGIELCGGPGILLSLGAIPSPAPLPYCDSPIERMAIGIPPIPVHTATPSETRLLSLPVGGQSLFPHLLNLDLAVGLDLTSDTLSTESPAKA